MIVKTIQEIADMLNCDLVGEDKTSLIQGVGIDSRQITENALYIPLIGQRADGHTFIDSVIQKGVKATLWQKDHTPYPEDITCILVDDTLEALQNLAKAYLNTLSCLVIGVTGSNGKTSCKDMLYSIFSQEKKTQKTQGNRNNEIGLPLTVLDLDKDVEVAILEMGMENKGEIDFLTHIARPDVSIITTIGSAHMENLGGKKQIAQAKLEILENLNLLQFGKLHPMSLSGGQKQRVAIGSAIASDKEVLVFDEPTSGLDYHHMIEVARNLIALSKMGKTLFIITHDPELIAQCCNYFMFIEHGKIKWSGGWTDDNRHRLNDFFSVKL